MKCQESKQACNDLQVRLSQVTVQIKGICNFCKSWRKEESTTCTERTSPNSTDLLHSPLEGQTYQHSSLQKACMRSLFWWYSLYKALVPSKQVWTMVETRVIARKRASLSLLNKTPGMKTRLQLLSQERACSSAWADNCVISPQNRQRMVYSAEIEHLSTRAKGTVALSMVSY